MSQFDLFADPAPVEVVAVAPAQSFIPQPPALIKQGQPWEPGPANLKPLRTFPVDWIETRLSDEEFAAGRQAYGVEYSDDYVMLQLLEKKGVRVSAAPANIKELYGWVDGQFLIRRRTVPGFTVICWQGPAKPRKSA